MSARALERALARLASSDSALAPLRGAGGFGVFPAGDRRRRPIVRLSAQDVRDLESGGALSACGDGYELTAAGRALARRRAALPEEAFAAQHRPIIERSVADDTGVRRARGHDPDAVMRRLGALRDGAGAPWLSGAELAAAARLRADWEAGERGMVRGSDWSAPPNGASARGPSNGREGALAAHCDARRRLADALASLAQPLRRVVESVCLREDGLEMLERAEAWPARSGKLALKLALAQLAAAGSAS